MSEPVKHHFVPQFIIRNFRIDTSVLFWNIEKGIIEKRNPKSILMKPNLYRDIVNHPNDIMAIEKKFSKFEDEISKLINQKFLSDESIELTRKENERLRMFLFLLSFRSENRKNQYINGNFDQSTKSHLNKYTRNNDYVDLWLRELNAILDCDSYDEIRKNSTITPVIKIDVENELEGYYMTIIESRGQDFILTDIYPTTEVFSLGFGNANYHMHSVFPISPNRCILLNSVIWKKGIEEHPQFQIMNKLSKIKGNLLREPVAIYIEKGKHCPEDRYIFNIAKAYKQDIIYLNHLLLNEAKEGIVFRDTSRIFDSIRTFTQIDVNTKNTLNTFLTALRDSELN